MKRSINVEIGEGLFSNEPVPVEIEFADHTATFYMTALTQAVIAELEKDGIKFNAASVIDADHALKSSRELFAKVVHGWKGFEAQGKEIPYTDENRDRVAEVGDLAAEIIKIAVQLAAHRQGVEEGN